MSDKPFSFSNKNVLILSPEPWGENLLSKHHIAATLAELGSRIWFISPFVNNACRSVKSPHKNIKLIVFRNFTGLNHLYAPIARLLARMEVAKLCKQIDQPIDVVWSFDPHRFQFLQLFKAGLAIYHPVDNHYTKLESRVVKEADLVVSNSQETLSRLKHKHKYKLGHGIASYFFAPSGDVQIPGNYKVKIGYVGNLANRFFDFDLFLKLVKSHPDIGFYAIGPRHSSNLAQVNYTFDWSMLDGQPNFFWLGQKGSASLPSYLRRMNILLVLYKSDRHGITVNSHKILEYLSSGKLIITPSHPENEALKTLILQVDSLDDIEENFNYALENLERFLSTEICAARIEKALTWTYLNRLKEMEIVINSLSK